MTIAGRSRLDENQGSHAGTSIRTERDILPDGTNLADLVSLERRTVSGRTMTDPAIYHLELERIFNRIWVFVATCRPASSPFSAASASPWHYWRFTGFSNFSSAAPLHTRSRSTRGRHQPSDPEIRDS